MNYKLGLANRKTLDRSNFNVQEVLKPLPRSPAEWKIFLKIVTKNFPVAQLDRKRKVSTVEVYKILRTIVGG